jgi:hypothetical protein
MTVKYGIRVPVDGNELWVMEDNGMPFPNNQRVQLFDTREAAESAAQVWKIYTIKEYFDSENFDWEYLAKNQTS